MTWHWEKQGLAFAPKARHPWMQTHAQVPVALPMGGDLVRVLFASRDDNKRSHVGYVDLDFATRGRVVEVSAEPLLAPGPLGFFDDHGVLPSTIVRHGDSLYLYFIGWNPGCRGPLFYASIGLAVSTDGGRSFQRVSRAPIMARSEHDPCLVTAPCVLIDKGTWRMWYVSGIRWEEKNGVMQSYYHIKYAESADGISWQREGHVAVDLRPGESNIGRPCVKRVGDRYLMWFSCNAGGGYRIGYAESEDGLYWTRRDEHASIGLSESGWDSEAIAYPHVFALGDRWIMLYNGNQFGLDGFGYAEGAPRAPKAS